jgi:hypothetical protein
MDEFTLKKIKKAGKAGMIYKKNRLGESLTMSRDMEVTSAGLIMYFYFHVYTSLVIFCEDDRSSFLLR